MPTRPEVVAQLVATGQFEVVEDTSAGYPQKVYRTAPGSFRELLESTRQFDDRTFLIYGDEELTYRQHYEKVASLAHYLVNAGIKKGDRIAIGMRNYPEWVISFWACQAIGAIVVAINAWWTGPEIAFALEDSTPAALLIDGERLERLAPLIPEMKELKAIVVARRGSAGPGGVDFSEATAKPADKLPDIQVEPEDYATILYTSGTTGKPKGAVATQRNHMTNYMNTMLGGSVARGLLGDFSIIGPLDMPQSGSLQTFPFFHIGGLTGLYISTATGAKLALMYKWEPVEGVRLVEKHKLSGVSGVPIVVRQLLETARMSGADVSSVLGVSSGGASVPPDLIRQIEKQFEGKTSPANGYGLTETTSAIITNSGADYFASPDSIGRPVPTCTAIIVDDNGKPLGDNEIGELWVRGPNVIPGYWKNPTATEAAFGGGWFRTGDLGYRDSNGLHYVVDRKKDVIIRGGENVYCAEVEAAILEHPLVKDVAVVGLPDEEYGEQVAAVIQVADQAAASSLPDELRAMMASKLARFKIPTSFKLTEGELPRTATGKVLKRELREMFGREGRLTMNQATQGLPVSEIAPTHRFDVAGLDTYLKARVEDFGEGLEVHQFQGGASNPTFLLVTKGKDGAFKRYVMRKKPPGVLLQSAHQVDREYAAMKALWPTGVPVPNARLLCMDDSIIGTAFYVMDYVPGRILMDASLPGVTPEHRTAVYADFVATLAKLHQVDFKLVGLGDWARSGDFIDRQLGRFTKQYRAAETEHIPAMEELIKALPEAAPGDRRVAIVHGDFKLGNTIFHPTEPKLMAVLDWELATVGDPLADLAFSAFAWHRGASGKAVLEGIGPESGIPSEVDYIRAYCRQTGRDGIKGWNFYLSFGMFRLASIMQGVYQRVLNGTVASNFAAVNQAPAMAEQALAMLNDKSLDEIS